jgi:hypothetical protein
MSEEFKKQRRYPRIRSEYPALVKRLDPELFTGLATARVMSLGGCMVEHEGPLGDGTPVELRFSVAGRIISARGIVASERKAQGNTYEVGVEFFSIPLPDLELLQQITRTADET